MHLIYFIFNRDTPDAQKLGLGGIRVIPETLHRVQVREMRSK